MEIDEWPREDPGPQPALDECFAHTNRETWQDMASMTRWPADNFDDALGDGDGEIELPATSLVVGEMGPPTLT